MIPRGILSQSPLRTHYYSPIIYYKQQFTHNTFKNVNDEETYKLGVCTSEKVVIL